jgi:hypothetical protein
MFETNKGDFGIQQFLVFRYRILCINAIKWGLQVSTDVELVSEVPVDLTYQFNIYGNLANTQLRDGNK